MRAPGCQTNSVGDDLGWGGLGADGGGILAPVIPGVATVLSSPWVAERGGKKDTWLWRLHPGPAGWSLVCRW